MAHYVYPATGQPLPPDIAEQVTRVPSGISDRYPRGGFFTADGIQVTKLLDAADGFRLAPPQDPNALTKVDQSAVLAKLDEILNFLRSGR